VLLPIQVIFICVIVWLIWNYLNKRYLRDFFSPFNLLLYFWVLPFFASFMMLSELQDGLSLEAALIIVVSTMILVGISMVPMVLLKGKPLTIRYTNYSLMLIRNGSWLVIWFYIVAFIALYLAEFREGSPLLKYMASETSNPVLHQAGKDSKLQVIAFGIFVAGMLSFYLGINSRAWASRILFLGLAIFVPILGGMKASKTDIFIPLLSYSALSYYHFRVKKVRIPKWLVILMLLVGMLMVSITFIRVRGIGCQGGYAGLIEFKYSEEIVFPVNEMVAIIYGYMSLGFQNFSNYIKYGDGGFHIGTSLLRPFLSALMQGDVADALLAGPYENLYVVSGAANVGTFLRDLYIEGGVMFCIIGSIINAALVNGFYMKFRKREGGMWMFIYIVFLFPWTWLFFMNAFSVLSHFVNAFYVFAIFSLFVVLKGRKRRIA